LSWFNVAHDLFLADLSADGISFPYGTAAAVTEGHTVCSRLATGEPKAMVVLDVIAGAGLAQRGAHAGQRDAALAGDLAERQAAAAHRAGAVIADDVHAPSVAEKRRDRALPVRAVMLGDVSTHVHLRPQEGSEHHERSVELVLARTKLPRTSDGPWFSGQDGEDQIVRGARRSS
jgi:hypothetical protein